MYSETTVEIDCPIEAVYDLATHHVVEWSEIVVVQEIIEENPVGVGTPLRIVTMNRGRRTEFVCEVVKAKPPTSVSVAMVGRKVNIDFDYELEHLAAPDA